MTQNVFTSMKGELFSLESEVIEAKYASTGERGYIITPSGKMIVVPTSRSHGDVFSEYLTKYLGLTSKLVLNGSNASVILAQYGHIAYMSSVSNIQNMKVNGVICESSILMDGKGIVSLPNDYSMMTLPQISSLKELIASNRTISGRKRVEMSYGVISRGLDITEEELFKILDGLETMLNTENNVIKR